MANDKIYLAQKDDLDNHINDRKNPHKLVAADIGAATPAYVDQQIALVTSTGIPKLNVVPLPIEATVDGQTEFFINLETFDALTDTVLVLDGRGMLLPNADFIVEGSTVIVNDPWNLGDIGGLLILKNVPMGDEGSVSGSVIAPGTIPFSALEEEIQGMIKNASGAGTGKLATYFFPFEATVDGQTVFIVPLESFDIENDTVFVVDGQGMLLPGIGYTVAGREITMAEPWSLGDGGGIYVLRNTINPDAEYVSGSIIANGSIPAEKLAEEYLPLDGSKSMFGQLIVERENYPKVHLKKKSTGAIGKYEISDNDELVLMATNQDDTDFARLYLRKNFSNISEILEVGDESNTYKVYGEHNKPTASDVHARPDTWLPTPSEIGAADENLHQTLNIIEFAKLGIDGSTLSATDLNANLALIVKQWNALMPRQVGSLNFALSTSSNMAKALLAKINADLGLNLYVYLDVRILKTSANLLRIYVYPQGNESYVYGFYASYNNLYDALSPFKYEVHPNGFSPTDHTHEADDVGALPIDGVGGVHNLKTYTALSQIGIDDATLSSEDFESNIKAIFAKMPDYSQLHIPVDATCNNFKLSLISKINADVESSFGSTNNFAMAVYKSAHTEYPGSVEVTKHLNGEIFQYKCGLNLSSVSPFISSYRPSGYLAKDKADGAHNIRTYTKLDQLGLDDSTMSTTDVEANVYAVINAMPTESVFTMRTSANNSPLVKSIKDRINSENGLNISDSVTVLLRFTALGTSSSPALLEVTVDSTAYDYVWMTRIDRTSSATTSSVTKFIPVYNPSGFLPLDGSVAMNGELKYFDGSKTLAYPVPMANAGFHNSVYRGKSLGSTVTAAQWAAIKAGTFEDMYIGDYWTIGGIDYRIAAFDYYYKTGDTSCETHHVVLVPDTNMYTHVMNDTNITDGAYVGSKMYTTGLTQAKTTINNAFGSAHILNHRQYLQNATTNGVSTGGAWYDSTIELMTEQNVYGCKIFGDVVHGTTFPNNYTIDKSQYPLFAFRPDMISNRQWFWLRDVANAASFAIVDSNGSAGINNASRVHGVRPAFSIVS